ncbi:hypothetical protein [Magnetococcus sp. PR-3]|uniref:hypothetical protein n=1 Tax=Magnetococcus sp. PR-3 TaxID=3120355 RepID=UPI002FCE5901
MTNIARFIRNTPPDGLQAYFATAGLHIGHEIDWASDARQIATPLIQAAQQMDAQDRSVLALDADRIHALSTESGQDAIFSTVGEQEREPLAGMRNGYARALWLFLNEPETFKRAEEVHYADTRRLGRMWEGFMGPADVTVSASPEHHQQFEQRIREHFHSSRVKVEVFPRERIIFKGEPVHLVQVVVYREGLPDSLLAFEGDDLVTRPHRPVFEMVLTYEADSGVIEVVTQGRESREAVARIFAETLLETDFTDKRVPLRRYDLSNLIKPFDFPTEPEDHIESVKVTLLQLRPDDNGSKRVTFEATRRTKATVYEEMANWQRDSRADGASFSIHQAKLSVRFLPEKGRSRGKIITVKITLPNGCSLGTSTEKERLICEKYLERWGLLGDV